MADYQGVDACHAHATHDIEEEPEDERGRGKAEERQPLTQSDAQGARIPDEEYAYGNKQIFGSPVNHIEGAGFCASQVRNTNLPFIERVKEWWHPLTFKVAMLDLDLIFWKSCSSP
ncbi:hypothetical protein BDZ97DRAFT_1917312 [Flammula alnicola]|nr:hypothetical protein BDZ97DRAFT_1917312 [Flammula alnicola]